MESSDAATASQVTVDPQRDVSPGPLRSTFWAQPPGAGEGDWAAEPVAVVPGVRPAPSPWVLVTELALADGDRVVVGLVGEIDIANAGYLRAELNYLIDAGQIDIVADLTQVRSISSSGLGVLVDALKKVRRVGGRLQLVAAADSIVKILRITRLTQVFAVHRTLDAALRP